VLVGEEDAAFAGGSYVIVQKYLHDLDGWNALSTEAQERIIGRTKLSDIELDDSIKPTSAHSALTTIVEDGKEIKILRDNMPFGRAAEGEFGTYFIGCSRSPRTIEQLLDNSTRLPSGWAFGPGLLLPDSSAALAQVKAYPEHG
jgi:putative iron-dependent peroxidase